MRHAVLATLVAGLAACSKGPQEFEKLDEVGKFQSESEVKKKFESLASSANTIPEVNNLKRPYEHEGYLIITKGVKTLLKFKGASGGLWVQGDITGQGIDASNTEMDVRLSGNTMAEVRMGGGVLWLEKLPNLKALGNFKVVFRKRTILVVNSITREELKILKGRIMGPMEVLAFECDLEPGRYKCSEQEWGNEQAGVSVLTVFAKKQ
jgi:hypothetical protein